jgi:hypothetical protein
LLGRRPPDKFRASQFLGRKLEIMATKEIDKSADTYVKVAGVLMVCLLAYGALTLVGVVR